MSRIAILLPLFALWALAATAQAPDSLRVVGTVPLPGEALKDSIVIFFDQPLDLGEIAEGADPEWFTIDPTYRGTYRIGPSFIAFTFAQRVRDADLKVTLSTRIRSHAGLSVAEDSGPWHFTSRPLKPRPLTSVAVPSQRKALLITFTKAVREIDFRDHVRVTSLNRDPIDTEIRALPGGHSYHLVFEEGTSWPVRVTVPEGLRDTGGAFIMGEPWSQIFPTNTSLSIRKMGWRRLEHRHQRFFVSFTDAVHADELRLHLTITDKSLNADVPYTLLSEGAADTHTIEIALGDPVGASPSLSIASGLTSLRGHVNAMVLERDLDIVHGRLAIVRQYVGSSNEGGLHLDLRLSHDTTADALRAHLSFDPVVDDVRIEANSARRFRIHGEFRSNTAYTTTLSSGLRFGMGVPTPNAISRRFKTHTVPSHLAFGHSGKYYFPKRNEGVMPIKARNVDYASVLLHRIFPGNLVVALDELNDDVASTKLTSHWSEEVGSTTVAIPAVPDETVDAWLDLATVMPEEARGVFTLTMSGSGRGANHKALVLTDMAALSHWNHDTLLIFVHDLTTLEATTNAEVSLWSHKNQPLARAFTDAQGFARFGDFPSNLGRPAVAVIEKGNDYTFLELEDREDVTRSISASLPQYDAEAYDAFVYADRNLYRPGEPVHLRWSVRESYGQAVADVPLLLRVLKPNGRLLLEQATHLSAFGSGGIDLATKKAWPTGRYTAQIRVPGNGKPAGSYTFQLEDFVPNRMKAAVEMEADHLHSGKEYTFDVKAEHLFGGPATKRRSDGRVYFERTTHTPEAWPGFTFGNDSEFTPDPIDCGEAWTDDDGRASFAFTYDTVEHVTFPLKATVVGSVYELGGRSVSDRTTRTLLPKGILTGIQASMGDGNAIDVRVAAINADESPADLATVQVSLEKEQWIYNVRRYRARNEPRWTRTFTTIDTKDVTLEEGIGALQFSARSYGYYRVRVHSEATPMFSTLKFYAYRGRIERADTSRPSLVKLTTDKEAYAPGASATVRIESPFDGIAIATILGPELHHLPPLAIHDGVAEVQIPLTDGHVPNTWVEVTVIHDPTEGEPGVHPYSSFARVNLLCPDPAQRLDVALDDVPTEIRPNTPLTVSVRIRDHANAPASAEVTLAAVDEGIHAITNYTTPDPFAYFMRPRRPIVERAHYYDRVAYDFDKPAAGGGVGRFLAKGAAAIGENWIKPVALWSGPVETNGDGVATVTVNVPQFNGQLRLVAMAHGASNTGVAETQVVVRQPYMLRTSLPRFLLPNDKATTTATVFNTTDTDRRATIHWATSGALAASAGSRTLDLPAKREETITVDIAALGAPAQGEMQWRLDVADGAGAILDHLTESAPLPVRAPASYTRSHSLRVLAAGEATTIYNAEMSDDEATEWRVAVSDNPLWLLQKPLSFVVRYPYGCVEQTTSKLWSIYLMNKQSQLLESVDVHDLEYLLQSGIDRLFSMQTNAGGLAYWPGGSRPYPYGSIYALHFLTLAESDGAYILPKENIEALRNYVRGLTKDWADTGPSALYRRIYGIYVLALHGDLEAIRAIDSVEHLTMSRSARYLLAAALAKNSPDRDRAKAILRGPTSDERIAEISGTLQSTIRGTAIELLGIVALGDELDEAARRANELTNYLADRRYGNTQEMAFVTAALHAYFKMIADTDLEVRAEITGPSGDLILTGSETYRDDYEGAGASYRVANTGQAPIYISVEIGGVPLNAEERTVAEGIHLDRSLFQTDGKAYKGVTFRQGDSYVVRTALRATGNAEIVVMSQKLPAGFELVNPRLNADALPPGRFEEPIAPSHLEMRDDRIIAVFDKLPSEVRYFYYTVRAVTPGTFVWPGAVAECMYNAAIRGATTRQSLTVEHL
jgi:uncharacterized protein YfaS (alpha-2-macroglobulin family)